MSNKILPRSTDVTFEPHSVDRSLPFIFHTDQPAVEGICNIHENFEILYIFEGKGTIRIDGSEYPVQVGDTVAINCYAVHQIINISELRFHCLIVDNDFCEENGLQIKELEFAPLLRDERTGDLMERVASEYNSQRPYRYAAIKCAVLEIMLYLCRAYGQKRQRPLLLPDSRVACICRTIEYIKDHLHKKLTLDDIAAFAGFSKFYFTREFKKWTGLTPMQYINTLRCEYAEGLLKSGKYSVKETAVMSGFDNFSYFTAVFKKHTSRLPSDYLKGSGSQHNG